MGRGDVPLGTLGIADTKASEPGQPVIRDPSRECVVGGPWAGYTPSGGYLIAQSIDDVVRQFGPWVYELMRLDPAVYGSLYLLYAGILAEGARVVPALTAEPGEIVSSRKRKRELKLAEQITDYWQRQIDGLNPGLDQVLWELLDDAVTGGCALAEPVYTRNPIENGPDKGRLGLASFAVKPRWSWGMRVDPFMRVQRIRGWTTTGWQDIDRAHFVLLSWQPRAGDPRGTRLLRPAYPAWNVKLQEIPDYAEYLKHHANPKLILTAGPYTDVSDTLDPVTGLRTSKSPQQRLLEAGQAFGNRSILALANGDTAQYLYSQGNGEAYLKGFDWADREIFRSIILGARAMQEAKHGSKADTDSSQDLTGMAVTQSRKSLHAAVRRDLLYTGTLLNWGKDVADRLTPCLTFGISDHLSPELMAAFGIAWAKGVFALPQRPWMLSKLGAPPDPVPDPNEIPAEPPQSEPDEEEDPDKVQDDDLLPSQRKAKKPKGKVPAEEPDDK